MTSHHTDHVDINITGGLLPPAPADLEARGGRAHEDARWRPHRPHDAHQGSFSSSLL